MCQGSITTKQPLSKQEIKDELRRLRVALREQGHAVTARRTAIYDVLLQANDHICVEHILESLERDHPAWRVNKTTVYRTLDLFQGLGLVYEMRRDDGGAQYELAMHGPHAHLLCGSCGRLQDLDQDTAVAFRRTVHAHQGFEVDLLNHALLGLCAECAHRAES
jgi:Fur family ferric uptake transcriptional regulator